MATSPYASMMLPFVVLYADPVGPTFPKENPAEDPVTGRLFTDSATFALIANELLSGMPAG